MEKLQHKCNVLYNFFMLHFRRYTWFKVLTLVLLKIQAFCVITLCWLRSRIEYRRVGTAVTCALLLRLLILCATFMFTHLAAMHLENDAVSYWQGCPQSPGFLKWPPSCLNLLVWLKPHSHKEHVMPFLDAC